MNRQTGTQAARVGIDIGGTFTDVALECRGRLFSAKALTDYAAPERAILDVLAEVVAQAGIDIGEIGTIIHGTTLATNALIQRGGARTAFVTTAGFRDVIEMRTESRFEQYDLDITLPPPLIARCDRFTLDERIDAGGKVLRPADGARIDEVVAALAKGGYQSVAVGFLHSYVNDIHERRLRDVLQQRLPAVSVSISSEVSPQMREYERFNTVCANAYVKPLMKSYLDRLSEALHCAGAACPLLMMHSGGGIMSVETAAEFPVRLVESGPAGGAIFAADIARRYQLESVLSFDMGGTTAKICLIERFNPKTARTFEVARTYRFKKGSGMPISIPVVEMVEIGAGGGSIAAVDLLKQIRVGPQSAGSEPGPACYRRGGARATVTDADLLLGRLDAEYFAGGTIVLSPGLAEQAVQGDVGEGLGLDAAMAAYGVSEVVDENMANAGRVHAVENGRDIADYTMITFGGAGPVHAARLCEKLGIARFLVPPGAGVGSAIGFLRAPFAFEAAHSAYLRLAAFDAGSVNGLLDTLTAEAESFARQGIGESEPLIEVTAYMRYAGQGWEIPVEVGARRRFEAGHGMLLKERFEAAYRRFFGRPIEGLDAEIVSWSVRASSPRPPTATVEITRALSKPAPVGKRKLFDADSRRFVEAAVFDRAELAVGACIRGPAVIAERETSTILSDRFEAVVQDDGCLLVERVAAGVVAEVAGGVAADAAGVAPDAIHMQVMWNRLISVVEEQALTLVRTAFSTSVREAGDLSAGVFDSQGRMLAQAVTGTPGHVNAMAEAVGHFIRDIGEDRIFEGDAYITNDPWKGTGHLHDITVVSPVFRRRRLIGYFACTAHVVDIGGRGFGPDGREVYEEGLFIPIMKFVERGAVNQDLVHIVRNNVREADQVVGDIYSLAACNEIGDRRLTDMLDEFALEDLQALGSFILENSRRATLEKIAALPRGHFRNRMVVDGYDQPVTMAVDLKIDDDRIVADFDGTSAASRYGINVPLIYTKAYACYGLKCALAPEIPNNAASLAPFEAVAPPGCILNALRPAPVSVRHVLGHFIPDLVLGALHGFLPGRIPAEGAGTLWNIHISARPAADDAAADGAGTSAADKGRRAEILMFNSGGGGARPTLDGLSATAFPSGVRTMSIEATEQVGPVVVWRKELRPDSGGAGRQRGGLGQVVEIGAADGFEIRFNAMFDRIAHPAAGRDGGMPGQPGIVGLDDGTVLRGKSSQAVVPAGRRLVLQLPGGGGYGDPSSRDKAVVAADLLNGYLSPQQARTEYGVSAGGSSSA